MDRLHHFRATREKYANLNLGVQINAQGVSPHDPRIFQTDLGSLELSCRGNIHPESPV